jgi:N-acetylglucosamine kinase-like BadF-type ATPase
MMPRHGRQGREAASRKNEPVSRMPEGRVRTMPVKQRTGEPPAAFFLGIDGGGSRTTAWLADDHHRILARVVTGPSNPVAVGLETARRNLLRAARRALRQGGLGRRKIEAVCAGIAGIAHPLIYRKLLRSFERDIPARHHLLTHDAAIALECALGKSPGVIVISGTGSIAHGRDRKDRFLRCGGWGSVFDDCGSGYDIGRKAVSAALRDFDGRGAPTRLGKDICRALRIKEITQVVSKSLKTDQIAALFPVVNRAADLGDPIARELCRDAGRDLSVMASALLSRIGGPAEGLRVVCAGGVFKSGVSVRRSFARHVRAALPGAKIALLRRHPVEGALSLAAALAKESESLPAKRP